MGSPLRPLRSCSVCPQNIGQFLSLVTLWTFQSSLQAVHDYLAHGLNLAITLGIHWRGIFAPNTEVAAKFAKSSTVELQSIIRYKGVRNPKPSDYILPYEFLHIYVPDISQSLRLCLFGEVIDGYQNES